MSQRKFKCQKIKNCGKATNDGCGCNQPNSYKVDGLNGILAKWKELKEDMGRELEDYTMEKWAKQGVLMMNTALTVRHNTPGAHMKWGKGFTSRVLAYLYEISD